MKTKIFVKLAVILVLAILFGQTDVPAVFAQTPASAASSGAAREKEACAKHLKQIYEGIQAYRRDHKELPNWLSDLVPNYLADVSIFICPSSKRTGEGIPYPHLADPKLASSYLYEFSDAEAGVIYQAGKMKMRQLKRLQMGVIGGDTPILRCLLHTPVLNVGFDGKLFESPRTWEQLFQDVANLNDLWPKQLLARFGTIPEESMRPALEQKAAQQARKQADPTALLGKVAPNFELELLEGGRFELMAQRDKHIVILDFWATWCGPCRAALPDLLEISKEYQDKGVLLRGIDLREEPSVIRGYLKKNNLPLSVLMDKEGSVAELYGVTGIPSTLIVGKDGSVQAVHIGYSSDNKQRLRQELGDLLAGRRRAGKAKD